MNYWLVRADWKTHGGGNQIERFVQEKIWENGYTDKFIKSVKSISKGDILCLADKSDLLCYGICIKNKGDGKQVQVDKWLYFDTPINFSGKGAYAKTIVKIANIDLIVKLTEKITYEKRFLNLNGIELKGTFSINNYSIKNNIYLNSIKIKKYFSIKNIEITNLKNKKEIYFVGGNGEGKTILLQAILLALKKEYSGHIIEYIRDIEDELELAVKDGNSNEYSSNYNIKNVFAYGINRNKTREKSDKYGYSGIFDTSDFKDTTFLRNPLEVLREENKITHEFIGLLNKHILQGSIKIEKIKSKILIKESIEEKENSIDFEKLSEGYKSTLIWLCDLLSRLIENDKEIKELRKFKAIVLIDEVDLYLHPKWKYNFVYNLRKIFPKIQFIMITHSTATVLGATEDAIFYKIYKENGETKISQPIESIKNLMANALNTSPLFDMTTARARNSNDDFDTSDDYIYTKIHEKIAQRVKGKKAIVSEDIERMIDEELDNFLKENDL